uniref:Uncharacterized protein n=1 Tax=Cafeteria roenbergensis TaxID=33653 RepID=A0A7S0PB20_CAFRO
MIDSAVALAARKSSAGSTGSAASASDVDAATPAASADAAAPGTAYRHPKSGANSPPLPQDAVLVLLPRRLRPASIPPSPRDDDAEAAVGRPVVSARSCRRLGAAGSAPRKHSVVAVERTWPVDSALLVMRADLSLARRAALEHAVRVELAVWDAMASALPSRSVVLGTSDDVTATGPSPRSALQEVAAVVAASSRSRRASSSSTSGTRSLQLLPSLQVGVLGALPSGTLVADAVAAAALQTLGVVLPVRRLQAVPPSESLRKLAVESPAHASGQATAAATAAAAAASPAREHSAGGSSGDLGRSSLRCCVLGAGHPDDEVMAEEAASLRPLDRIASVADCGAGASHSHQANPDVESDDDESDDDEVDVALDPVSATFAFEDPAPTHALASYDPPMSNATSRASSDPGLVAAAV